MTPPTRIDEGFAESTSLVLSGTSEQARRLRLQVSRMAPHVRTVLLIGERGVGKEAIARGMHRLGPRAAAPFVRSDASDFASDGAEPAGMLYLSGMEIVPLDLQPSLLLRLQRLAREVRITTASEHDLRGMVSTGRLLPELWERIATVEIRVPPLRERSEDVAALASALLQARGSSASLSDEALSRMQRYHWPGNLAEMMAVIDRICVCEGSVGVERLGLRDQPEDGRPQTLPLQHVIERHVAEVLERCAGNKLKAAEALGISRSTLYRMLDAVSG